MRTRRIIVLTLLAILGVALAVGVTMAATSVTSQRVGLDSEPLTTGDDLVPRTETSGRGRGKDDTRTTRSGQATTTTSSRTTTTTTPAQGGSSAPIVSSDDHGGSGGGDDSSGRGRGRGRGRGGGADD